jgi:hypothetical protein
MKSKQNCDDDQEEEEEEQEEEEEELCSSSFSSSSITVTELTRAMNAGEEGEERRKAGKS